ncbi:lytic transglycosylase domain-containing protein [Candidatus Hydrogenosomobacter endosymbioticus]|uniref:Transglycosylase SLT domain-containing protein n=1 Tax=Candidatus Hydrogenosomobacter endosymbioticus TaxID=2558174 RepID=A0ABM7V8B7_9PROT|nr:lytic transglycosylase domain-containing protein [Candidatus Hydrogenosomobacter endosymbioticus]BDB96019.1 hypothetical protein HYD_1520 [Candidatus Hydrogenosomobacter endosymbioticus]
MKILDQLSSVAALIVYAFTIVVAMDSHRYCNADDARHHHAWRIDILALKEAHSSENVSFSGMTNCFYRNPDWLYLFPSVMKELQKCGENSLVKDRRGVIYRDVKSFFDKYPPVTASGWAIYIGICESLADPHIKSIAKRARSEEKISRAEKAEIAKILSAKARVALDNFWREDFTMSISKQKDFLKLALPYLSFVFDRLESLLWNDKKKEAVALLNELFKHENRENNPNYKIYAGCIALTNKKEHVSNRLVDALLNCNLRSTLGKALFRWAYTSFLIRERRIEEAIRASNVKFKNLSLYKREKLWKLNIYLARELIQIGNEFRATGKHDKARKMFSKAMSVLKDRKLGSFAEERAEHAAYYKSRKDKLFKDWPEFLWLLGWVHLYGLNQPKEALLCFSQITNHAHQISEDSRARYIAKANYWKAMCFERLGRIEESKTCLKISAQYPFFFYGQAAMLKLELPIVASYCSSHSASGKACPSKELAIIFDVIKTLHQYGAQQDMFSNIAKDYSKVVKSYTEAREFISFMKNFCKKESILFAKKLGNRFGVLFKDAFPMVKLSQSRRALDEAFVHAIILAESSFNPSVISPVGAIGLMQLMPETAKEEALGLNIKFDKRKLFDPSYNIRLGTSHLEKLLRMFDGDYIFAVAAYNAGKTCVCRWRDWTPRHEKNIDKAIEWIENIPYAETRSYVQRVLENMAVYRSIMNSPYKSCFFFEKLEK